MKFVVRMAFRETRSSWKRLLFFFICIAVGVGAIVTLRSVIQNVRGVFGAEVRSLTAADVLISTSREWRPEVLAVIDKMLADAGATQRTETIETPTMARPANEALLTTRMVELKAVQAPFPLYGTLELDGGQAYSHALLASHGVLVGRELLPTFGLKVGDRLMLGQASFEIRGVIKTEPGRRVGEFSLGPRVLIDFDDLPSTGLLRFGSRARRVLLVRVPDARIDALVVALQNLRSDFVNARSYRAQDDEIGRDFDRAENYLSLVGLVIVILGGIAVSSVTRVFVLQKMRSIAVLKCLGATSGQVVTVYLLQILTLGLAGGLLGVGLARLVIAAIPLAVGESASILATVEYGVTWSAAAQGVTVGALITVLFSVVPLLRIRVVKPSLLLRDETPARRLDWTRIVAAVLVSAGLVAVTAWQAASLKVGLIVCAGFCGVAIVLLLAGWGLVKVVSPLSRSRSFALRHAVLHLSRPGNQTRMILLAVGLGAFFIIGVRSLQASLLEEFKVDATPDAPDMFLMDVQRDQSEELKAFLLDPATGAGPFQIIPVLRARITGVQGREASLESFEDVRARGSLAREYTVTYRDRLEPNERIVRGAFWRGPSAEAEVSLEQGMHERFRIDVGDTMRFDILGRIVSARVTSIRAVDFTDARSGGFMVVFRPGVLETAPQSFIAPLKGPGQDEARVRFQHDLVQRFPNVSVIDFREILANIRDVMSRVTLAITVVGGLVLLSGALILIGAVAMTKFQRVYEAAVFKTLGATTRTIGRMLLLEYGVLGLLAGTVGSAAAVGLTWGVSRYALEIPWRPFLLEHATSVVATALLVAAIGVASSLDVLRHKPLSTLRAE